VTDDDDDDDDDDEFYPFSNSRKTKFDCISLTFCEIKNCRHKKGRCLRNI
jgi:hypothetical protein